MLKIKMLLIVYTFFSGTAPCFGYDVTVCKKRIPQLLCFADQKTSLKDIGLPGRCVSSAAKYSSEFEKIFDHYPLPVQRLFCSLKNIYIETSEGWFTALSNVDKKAGETPLILLGVHERVLKKDMTFSTWASVREQRSFGNKGHVPNPSGIVVETTESPLVNTTLYFAIAHEFGHILDHLNDINPDADLCQLEGPDPAKVKDCPVKDGQWAAISWSTTKVIRPIPERDGLLRFCSIFCDHLGGYSNPSVAKKLYQNLEHSPFLGTFTTLTPWDEWADSFAFYLTSKELHTSYIVKTPSPFQYDLMAKLESPQFKEKLDFIKEFLVRRDLNFPK